MVISKLINREKYAVSKELCVSFGRESVRCHEWPSWISRKERVDRESKREDCDTTVVVLLLRPRCVRIVL